MEEILASIRRIISEDAEPGKAGAQQAAAAAKDNDVLELTDVVHDDGTVGRIDSPGEMAPRRRSAAMRSPEPEQVRQPSEPRATRRAAPAEPRPPRSSDLDMVDKDDRDGILSSQASSAITNAFGMLSRERDVTVGSTALEDIVTQMMRPLLAAWLDEHLPEIVERVVQQEVERAARTSGRRR
jgi:cell pole-organizing protein PopZ